MDARTQARFDHVDADTRPANRNRPDADGITTMFVLTDTGGRPVAAFPNRAAMRKWLGARGAGSALFYRATLVPLGS